MALRSVGERERTPPAVSAQGSPDRGPRGAYEKRRDRAGARPTTSGQQLQSLQGFVDERIAQGGREAEDIRSQIAPLLEANGARSASDERLHQEFDRLRESLAESLGDLSERLRRAVRGI